MRTRQQELTPRRTSSRIQHLQQVRQEQDLISEEYAEMLERDRLEEDLKRQQTDEKEQRQREAQERNRRAQERQKAFEERSERVRARNERLEEESDDEGVKSMLEKMQKVLKLVKSHKDAWPFLQPVDDAFAPSYHHIIKEPMDISKMEEKIRLKQYKSQMEMENDFKKMVNNCEVYNGVGNTYTNMAFSLWRVFLKSVRKHFGETMSWPRLRPSGCMYIANSTNENHHIKIVIRSFPNGKRHKKKAKKKRKRPPGMKAIEALALAAEEALKNSNFEDDSSTNDQVSSEFPGLKISTTQSHPPSMLVKYSRKDSEESDSDYNSAADSWKERPAPNSKRKCVRDGANGDVHRRNNSNASLRATYAMPNHRSQANSRQGNAKSSVPTAAARKMYVDSEPKKKMDFSVFDFVDETPPQPRPKKKPSATVSPMRRKVSTAKEKPLEWNLLKPLTLQIPPISSQPKDLSFAFNDQGDLGKSMCAPHLMDVSPSFYSKPYFQQPVVSQNRCVPCYNSGLHQHAVKL